MAGAWGVPTGLTDDHPRFWRFSRFDDLGASASHVSGRSGPVHVEERVYWAANTNVLDNYDDATRTSQDAIGWHSTYRDRRWGGAVSASDRPADGPVTLHAWTFVDHSVHRAISDVGEDEKCVSTTLLSGALAGELASGRFGAFFGAELDGEIPGLESAFAAAPLAIGPSVGLRWKADRIDMTLGVARRSRAPTLKERFSEAMGAMVPNLDLAQESAWHVGVDVAARPSTVITLRASVHDAEVDGLIEAVPIGGGVSQNQNLGTARLAGAEGAVELAWPAILETRVAAGWQYARRTDLDPPDDRLQYRPAWQVSADELAALPHDLSAWVGVHVVGPQLAYDDDTLVWGRLGASSRVDAAVGWAPDDDVTVRVRCTNVLDDIVQTTLGYPEPGRELWAEVAIRR